MAKKGYVNDDKLVSLFFEYLQKEHSISRVDVEKLLKKKPDTIVVPISVFGYRSVGSFEAIVKYLRENLRLSINQISELTNRTKSTIGVVYHKASKKLPMSYDSELLMESEYSIPVSKFKSRKLSVLETIVCFLKEDHGLRFSQIARLLSRDDRTIWTVYNRANNKRKDEI